MKIKNVFIGIGILIIIVIGSWIIFSVKIKQSIAQQEEIGILQENIIKETVLLIIDYGEGTPKTFENEFNKGITAFDLLKKEAEELNIPLKIKTYDIGIFIESIGNKENGRDGKYWLYYVNGEMPWVSVDKYELNPGDKIEFKFEKSPF